MASIKEGVADAVITAATIGFVQGAISSFAKAK